MRNTFKFAFVIICCFLCQIGGLFAQNKTGKSINTVFDDAMVKSIGLTMNLYYNKLYANYYEHNDYEGPKMGFNFTYSCPLVVINNRHINEISPGMNIRKRLSILMFCYLKPIKLQRVLVARHRKILSAPMSIFEGK